MIRRSVSAAYLIRDGFTGQAMTQASVLCTLDGQLCRPIWKPGGYLVLPDLEPGAHTLLLSSRGYRDELVAFTVCPGVTVEEALALKPGADYSFHEDVTWLALTLTAGGAPLTGEVWLAAATGVELRLAQDEAKPGEEALRLFCRGSAARLPIPGSFLFSDGAQTEMIQIRTLEEGLGRLGAPLKWTHVRGKLLLPAQSFHAESGSALNAVFRTPGRVEVLAAGGCGTLQLAPGENHLSLDLK